LPLALALVCAIVGLLAWAPAHARAKLPAPPRLPAASGAVFEASTGEPLYGFNAGVHHLMASTTKMMTALVTVDRVGLDKVCTATSYVPQPAETRVGLRPGERMSVRDLLRGLLLPSGNDAAEALAVCAGGTRSHFVELMNEKARALGLKNTHYETPVGLDEPGNYSSAADLARLGIDLLRDRFLARTVDMESVVLTTGDSPRTVVNTNTLLGEYPWIDGVKTGHTNAAGYLLIAAGRQHGMTMVAAVTDTPSEAARDSSALALLRWAFATHRLAEPVRSGVVYASARQKYRPEHKIALVAARPVRELVGDDQHVAVSVEAPAEIEGPLPRNAVVGSLTVTIDGRAVDRVSLVTKAAVSEVGLISRAAGAIGRPGSLIAIVVIVGGAAAVLSLRRHESRRRRGRADMEAA
jgi:D-alanyl-D-alanine carboxypeptidase (penicillin-binding protein 5/6)